MAEDNQNFFPKWKKTFWTQPPPLTANQHPLKGRVHLGLLASDICLLVCSFAARSNGFSIRLTAQSYTKVYSEGSLIVIDGIYPQENVYRVSALVPDSFQQMLLGILGYQSQYSTAMVLCLALVIKIPDSTNSTILIKNGFRISEYSICKILND